MDLLFAGAAIFFYIAILGAIAIAAIGGGGPPGGGGGGIAIAIIVGILYLSYFLSSNSFSTIFLAFSSWIMDKTSIRQSDGEGYRSLYHH